MVQGVERQGMRLWIESLKDGPRFARIPPVLGGRCLDSGKKILLASRVNKHMACFHQLKESVFVFIFSESKTQINIDVVMSVLQKKKKSWHLRVLETT
jgi:hypothetical protein